MKKGFLLSVLICVVAFSVSCTEQIELGSLEGVVLQSNSLVDIDGILDQAKVGGSLSGSHSDGVITGITLTAQNSGHEWTTQDIRDGNVEVTGTSSLATYVNYVDDMTGGAIGTTVIVAEEYKKYSNHLLTSIYGALTDSDGTVLPDDIASLIYVLDSATTTETTVGDSTLNESASSQMASHMVAGFNYYLTGDTYNYKAGVSTGGSKPTTGDADALLELKKIVNFDSSIFSSVKVASVAKDSSTGGGGQTVRIICTVRYNSDVSHEYGDTNTLYIYVRCVVPVVSNW